MWTCPKCKRPFKHKTQYHSCVTIKPDSLFEKYPLAGILYKIVEKKMKAFGKDVVMSAAKSAVFAKANGTFASLKPMKDCLVIEFLLPEETLEFPIEKTLRYTKTKIAHYMRVDGKEQINKQLINWLKTSYLMNKK